MSSLGTALTSTGPAIGRLFVLDVGAGRILSMLPDGSDRTAIVTGCRHPDGIVELLDAKPGTSRLSSRRADLPHRRFSCDLRDAGLPGTFTFWTG